MQGSQAANHTHDLLTQRIQLCCEILQSVNWKWGRTLFRDSTSESKDFGQESNSKGIS